MCWFYCISCVLSAFNKRKWWRWWWRFFGTQCIFIKRTGWTLAMALPWWQHRKHRLGIIIIIIIIPRQKRIKLSLWNFQNRPAMVVGSYYVVWQYCSGARDEVCCAWHHSLILIRYIVFMAYMYFAVTFGKIRCGCRFNIHIHTICYCPCMEIIMSCKLYEWANRSERPSSCPAMCAALLARKSIKRSALRQQHQILWLPLSVMRR